MKLEKLKLLVMLLALVVYFAGCKLNDDETAELISSNLLRIDGVEGFIDPALLVGQWNVVKFAYTANGNKISNVTDIPIDPRYDIEWIVSNNGISIDEAIDMFLPKLRIPAFDTEFIATLAYHLGISIDEATDKILSSFEEEVGLNDLWSVSTGIHEMLISSLSGNLINLTPATRSRTSLFSTPGGARDSDTDKAIKMALRNARSFVVKSDELIIYFKGDKKKNLLILKKQ